MNVLLSSLRELPEYEKLLRSVEQGEIAALSGVGQINRSHVIAAVYEQSGRPMVVLCQDDLAAQRIGQELSAFLGQEIPLLPSREWTFYDTQAASRGWEQKRLRQLYDLGRGKTKLQIMTLDSMGLRTMPKSILFSAALTVKVGASFVMEELLQRLVSAGYTRASLVEGIGQFALRGGILDVYSPAYDAPVRIEFFGDEVDAMGFFDVTSQRRTENCEQVVLLPVSETQPRLHPQGLAGLCGDLRELIARQKRRRSVHERLLRTLEADLEKLEQEVSFPAADRYISLIYPDFTTAADYISQDAVVVFCDHGNLSRASRTRQKDFGLELDSLLESGLLAGELCEFQQDWHGLCQSVSGRPVVFFDSFLSAGYPEELPPKQLLSITAKQLPSYGGNLEAAAADLQYYQKNHFRSLVLCGNRRRGEILQKTLSEKGVGAFLAFPLAQMPQPGQILIADGALPAGMEYPALGFAVLTEGQLVAPTLRRQVKPAKKKATNRQKLNSFTDLSPGDLVVHEYHGIGRYVGMEQMKIDGALKDYVKIAYQGSDALYVPATQLDLVCKYIGGGEEAPVRLNKLGGDAWQKTKQKAKAAAKDLAAGLIKLYAERQRRMGFAFAADTPWQAEFEESFEFAETDDQLRCIAEIKRDMQSPSPMDRLLCGDVGFGKTEVALRAAMKAMLDGKQVAILVPTTVLAQQHYLTAMKRFQGFPVTIDVLSRFRTAAQQKKTLFDLQTGKVDLIIGTHKLLQKDVKFKDLGLLIVDEEQRFGVTHKERLKELSVGVDVLTLSATPIPRTLNMALSGIRDMSTIEQPPQDRYPVQTFVLEHDDRILDDAIRELGRGGQVYYLHNRVETIEQVAARIKARISGAEVAVAHGKMNEESSRM